MIAREHVCLRARQACRRALDRRYHRYGFHCHGLRLTREPVADMMVSVRESADPVYAPARIGYAVEVSNLGPQLAREVVLTLTLPAAPVSVEPSAGTCTSDGATVSCRLGTLPVGAQASLNAVLKPSEPGSLEVRAAVSSATRDLRRGNNSTSEATAVLAGDSVRGGGSRPAFGGIGTVVTEVDAQSGPRGELAEGTFTLAGNLVAQGRVICLTVSGNRATVRGIVEASPDPRSPPGTGVALLITDNGEPGAGRDTNLNLIQVEDARSCPLDWPEVTAPQIPLSDGDFVVQDADG